jgi:drug/metabolite transporter (DMT)-like permease
MDRQRRSYLFAAITILCWATVPTAFKIGLRYQDNFQLLLGATIVSLIILLVFLLINGKWKELFSFKAKDYLFSAFLGFLNPFLYYLILFKAYSVLPGQVAQPLNMIWPIVLVLISIPLLKQKISLRSIFAMIISFSGVILISSQGGRSNFRIEQLPGIFLALGSSFIWAFFWILNVKDKRDEILKLFLNFTFALIFLLISMPIFHESFPLKYEAIAAMVYVGFFEMGLAFIFWLKALQLTKTTDQISNLIYIDPFLSLFFIHYIAGEKIYLTTIAGLILVVMGIIFQKIRLSK